MSGLWCVVCVSLIDATFGHSLGEMSCGKGKGTDNACYISLFKKTLNACITPRTGATRAFCARAARPQSQAPKGAWVDPPDGTRRTCSRAPSEQGFLRRCRAGSRGQVGIVPISCRNPTTCTWHQTPQFALPAGLRGRAPSPLIGRLRQRLPEEEYLCLHCTCAYLPALARAQSMKVKMFPFM